MDKDEKKRQVLKKSGPFDKKVKGGSMAGTWPAPHQCDAFISNRGLLSSDNMLTWAASNRTLLNYLYTRAHNSEDVQMGWQAMTAGCRIEPLGCWSVALSPAPNARRCDGRPALTATVRIVSALDRPGASTSPARW